MADGLFNPMMDFATAERIAALESKERFLPATYTVDTLPPPSKFPFMYAAVSDLGGGADMVISDGTYWKHVRRGTLATVPANTPISVIPLKTPSIFSINGSITSNMMITADQQRLYPGYQLTVKRQGILSSVLGLVGTLGLKTNATGAPTLALTETSTDLIWDGTQFVAI